MLRLRWRVGKSPQNQKLSFLPPKCSSAHCSVNKVVNNFKKQWEHSINSRKSRKWHSVHQCFKNMLISVWITFDLRITWSFSWNLPSRFSGKRAAQNTGGTKGPWTSRTWENVGVAVSCSLIGSKSVSRVLSPSFHPTQTSTTLRFVFPFRYESDLNYAPQDQSEGKVVIAKNPERVVRKMCCLLRVFGSDLARKIGGMLYDMQMGDLVNWFFMDRYWTISQFWEDVLENFTVHDTSFTQTSYGRAFRLVKKTRRINQLAIKAPKNPDGFGNLPTRETEEEEKDEDDEIDAGETEDDENDPRPKKRRRCNYWVFVLLTVFLWFCTIQTFSQTTLFLSFPDLFLTCSFLLLSTCQNISTQTTFV